MKTYRLMAVLVLCLLPATAGAQIIIEAINESDPSAVVVIEPASSDDDDEDDEAASMSEEDRSTVKRALVGSLSDAYSMCLKGRRILRPSAAKGAGSVEYKIDDEGSAKYQTGSTTAEPGMFHRDNKAWKERSEAARGAVIEKGNGAFASCVKVEDVRVRVTGPATVTMSFTWSWKGGEAVLDVGSFDVALQ